MTNHDVRSVLDAPLEPVIGLAEGETRWRRMTVCALVGLFAFATPASAGAWKHEVVPNNGDELTYRENGKLLFYLGCGRGFALHVKYPGEARKEGEADSYQLPAIDAGAWHKALEACKN